MRYILLLVLLGALASCSKNQANQTAGGTASLGPTAATYAPRVGVAVTTGARTCLAIRNPNLAPSTPVTLVSPMLPQTFSQVEVGGATDGPCPVSKDVDTSISNYDLHVPQGTSLPKLTPLIAVTGTSAVFGPGNNNTARADLDQNGKFETFRACSSNDGIHLTVWSGNSLDGTLLWHGYYYEPSNPGLGPACTAKETPAP